MPARIISIIFFIFLEKNLKGGVSETIPAGISERSLAQATHLSYKSHDGKDFICTGFTGPYFQQINTYML